MNIVVLHESPGQRYDVSYDLQCSSHVHSTPRLHAHQKSKCSVRQVRSHWFYHQSSLWLRRLAKYKVCPIFLAASLQSTFSIHLSSAFLKSATLSSLLSRYLSPNKTTMPEAVILGSDTDARLIAKILIDAGYHVRFLNQYKDDAGYEQIFDGYSVYTRSENDFVQTAVSNFGSARFTNFWNSPSESADPGLM